MNLIETEFKIRFNEDGIPLKEDTDKIPCGIPDLYVHIIMIASMAILIPAFVIWIIKSLYGG